MFNTEVESKLAVGVERAADMLDLSSYTIRGLIRAKRLASFRCGTRILIPVAELRRFMESDCPSRTAKEFPVSAQATV